MDRYQLDYVLAKETFLLIIIIILLLLNPDMGVVPLHTLVLRTTHFTMIYGTTLYNDICITRVPNGKGKTFFC